MTFHTRGEYANEKQFGSLICTENPNLAKDYKMRRISKIILLGRHMFNFVENTLSNATMKTLQTPSKMSIHL